mgnify:CR=1 FL=1
MDFDISQIQNIKDENNSFDEMRISFLELFITKKAVFVLSLIAMILLIFLGLEISLIFIVSILMLYVLPAIRGFMDLREQVDFVLEAV